ncbi:MAG TPA: hypothetical protein PLP17_08025 [Oligoflexia bacterium]|nr:hypothetical protein [Oligoflexia bacterium]
MKMHCLTAVIVAFFAAVVPQTAFAQIQPNRQLSSPVQIVQLHAQALEQMLALNNDCGTCDANISGKWMYVLLKDNVPYLSETVTFTQTGKSFKAVGMHYTIVGSLRGQWLDLTLVVSGEEAEGYVMKVGGTIDSKRITGVFQDSNGKVGSFIAIKK